MKDRMNIVNDLPTEHGESEQQVLEQLGAENGTLVPGPGLNGLQVALMHPHLHLLRHAVGTVTGREREREGYFTY